MAHPVRHALPQCAEAKSAVESTGGGHGCRDRRSQPCVGSGRLASGLRAVSCSCHAPTGTRVVDVCWTCAGRVVDMHPQGETRPRARAEAVLQACKHERRRSRARLLPALLRLRGGGGGLWTCLGHVMSVLDMSSSSAAAAAAAAVARGGGGGASASPTADSLSAAAHSERRGEGEASAVSIAAAMSACSSSSSAAAAPPPPLPPLASPLRRSVAEAIRRSACAYSSPCARCVARAASTAARPKRQRRSGWRAGKLARRHPSPPT